MTVLRGGGAGHAFAVVTVGVVLASCVCVSRVALLMVDMECCGCECRCDDEGDGVDWAACTFDCDGLEEEEEDDGDANDDDETDVYNATVLTLPLVCAVGCDDVAYGLVLASGDLGDGRQVEAAGLAGKMHALLDDVDGNDVLLLIFDVGDASDSSSLASASSFDGGVSKSCCTSPSLASSSSSSSSIRRLADTMLCDMYST